VNKAARVMSAARPKSVWVSEELASSALGETQRRMVLKDGSSATVRAESGRQIRVKHGVQLVAHPLRLEVEGVTTTWWLHTVTREIRRVFLCYPRSHLDSSGPLLAELSRTLDRIGIEVVRPPQTNTYEDELRGILDGADAVVALAVPFDADGVQVGNPTTAWVHNFVGAARSGLGHVLPALVIQQRGTDVAGWSKLNGVVCPVHFDPEDPGSLRRVSEHVATTIARWRETG